MANLIADKYYILNSSNELACDDAFDTRDEAIEVAREIADRITWDDVLYIQPTEQQYNVELLCAEYVIRVNDGEIDGCYDADEER